MEAHCCELFLNVISLCGFVEANGDVGFFSIEVEDAFFENDGELDIRILFFEAVEARGYEGGAYEFWSADGERTGEAAMGVDELSLDSGEFRMDIVGGFIEHFALFGKGEAASVAAEERDAEGFFEGADLAGDGGLAEF